MKQERTILNCLNLKKRDKLLIFCGKKNEKYGKKVYEEALKITKKVLYINLEDYKRPLINLPAKMKKEIIKFKPTASIYLASSQKGEIKFRIKLLNLLKKLKVRHLHLVGLDEKIWRSGLKVDYNEVKKITERVYRIVKRARKIEVTNKEGTNITFEGFYKWVKDSGILIKAGFNNLPAGEVFTCPKKVNGTFVARVIGDYFIKYGKLREKVILEIKNSKLEKISCEDKKLERELKNYLVGKKCYKRVGEIGIGTNIFLKRVIGNLLQDEKLPTCHIALGDPYKEETGANYSCDKHIDFITLKATIKVNGKLLMKNGKYVINF